MERKTGTSRPDCKGCAETVRISPVEAEAAFARLRLPSGTALAAADTYAARMTICGLCADFEYGTTCRHCGCLMQVRARLAGDGCPHPAGSRWRGAT